MERILREFGEDNFGFHVLPPLAHKSIGHLNGLGRGLALRALKEIILAFLSSAALLSARGFVLVSLFVASVSMEIGLSVLLWQQLCYIYEGETYLNHLNSQKSESPGKKDCQNLFRFLGCP
ncbi:protein S-acyltransferase 11-like [Tripterygium wilfordii]|uniref:protein S-acyltransferase 11-like n=1 Tax=Tripterygium wilfordii TaxID=458696 RepID=UPI0018F7EBAD|nr:protein S-acyltransferase 11-like [Tripterygium wilfordii]